MNDSQKVRFLEDDFSRMASDRSTFEPLWERINQIFYPRRADIRRIRQPGKQYGETIHDAHPQNVRRKFTTGMINYTMNKSVPWLQFLTPKAELMKDDEIRRYLQRAAHQILFGLGRGNFYGQAPRMVDDGVSVGTGVMVPEADLVKGVLMHRTIHPSQSYLRNDRYGRAVVYAREFEMTAIDAYMRFKETRDKLPTKLVNQVIGKSKREPFTKWKFLYFIYRNVNFKSDALRASDDKYKTFYVVRHKVPAKSQLVEESGRPDFAITWRMLPEEDQAYGLSVCADALTNALIGNQLGKKQIQSAHRSVEPVLAASQGVNSGEGGMVRTNPGAVNWFKNPTDKIDEVMKGGNWPVSDAEMKRIHDQLDDMFMIRFFEMLNQPDLPQQTAFEVGAKLAEKALLLPGVDSYETEMLNGSIEAQWAFEERAGRMPDPPDRLLDEGKGEVETQYIGPLQQLQRSALKGRGLIEGIALAREIASIWQDSLIKVDGMKVMEGALVSKGFPEEDFRTDDEVAEIQAAQAQAAAQDEQLETAERISDMAAKHSKTIEPGSGFDTVLQNVA